MSNYVQSFFTVPFRILQLQDLTIQLLRFYETIFHFWHTENACFLTNTSLKERTGMKSNSTIAAAFQFFEKCGEMKRVTKGGRRYIVQPTRVIETDEENVPVDNSAQNSSNSGQGLAVARGGSRCSERGGLAVARHNNNNINNININKSSYIKLDEKKSTTVDNQAKNPAMDLKEANKQKHSWANQKEKPRADVTTQTTSYKPDKKYAKQDPNSERYQAFVNTMPSLKRKYEQRKESCNANELSSGTTVSTQVSDGEHVGNESDNIASDGSIHIPSELRGGNRVMAPCSIRTYFEKAGLASQNAIQSAGCM